VSRTSPHRRSNGLLVSLVFLCPACASTRSDGLVAGSSRSVPDRAVDRRASFWAEHGTEWSCAIDREWVLPDEPQVLHCVVRNGSPRRLTLKTERTHGLWPFASTQRSRVAIYWKRAALSARGVDNEESSSLRPLERDLDVAPLSEAAIEVAIPDQEMRESDYVRLEIQVVVYPVAVQFEGEPERFGVLGFPPVVIHVCNCPRLTSRTEASSVRPIPSLDVEAPGLIARAVFAAQQDTVATVENLVQVLPGLQGARRQEAFVALRWMTGLSLGNEVEPWRGWWASEEGGLWTLLQQRKL